MKKAAIILNYKITFQEKNLTILYLYE